MSANRTNRTVLNHCLSGLPHQTKIARKPEGVGVEIRCSIDVESMIMLRLELQEGKEAMQKLKYYEGLGSSGTASVLRLVEPWMKTNRVIYGDSAFGSVRTAAQLAHHGLGFIGMVKTATKRFPKAFLTKYGADHNLLRTGQSVYLTAEGHPLLRAVGWYSKKAKFLIATVGTNLPAPEHVRYRYRINQDGNTERFIKTEPICQTAYEYFNSAQKIDVHNHLRQGSLAMERAVPTQSWSFRIICTLLGMIIVDAFKMYQLEQEDRDDVDPALRTMDFSSFVTTVTRDLVNNEFQGNTKKRRQSESMESSGNVVHALELLSEHPTSASTNVQFRQLRCKICNHKTSFICGTCSTTEVAYAVCGPSKRKLGRAQLCHASHLSEFFGKNE